MVTYSPAFATLSDNAQHAIQRAFTEVFNGAVPQTIDVISGGLSGAQLFRIVVDDQTYVLRINPNPAALAESTASLDYLRFAAEQGLAPLLYWADPNAGLTLMQHIKAQPLASVLGANPGLVTQFAEKLRVLHHGPTLSQAIQLFDFIRDRISLLPDLRQLPENTQAALDRLELICTALKPHLKPALCHNDLNPANVLFDGEQIWFVDWETASINDAFFDLATVVHWFAPVPAMEEQLLQTYFQRRPHAWEIAKLELMKYVSRCLLGTIFLSIADHLGAQANSQINGDSLPRFAEALQAIANGQLQLHIPTDAYRFGLVIIQEAWFAQQDGIIDAALAQLALNP